MASTLKFLLFASLSSVWLCGCASSAPKQLTSTVQRQQQAEQAYANGNLTLALSDYQALTRDVPTHADFWFRLGNVHVRMKQPDQAAAAYQRVLQLEPDHAKAWHNLGIIRLRQAEAAFGQSARFAATLDPALQRQSAQMAHGLATLSEAPTKAPSPSAGSSEPANMEPQP